jgi:hypothetical protein
MASAINRFWATVASSKDPSAGALARGDSVSCKGVAGRLSLGAEAAHATADCDRTAIAPQHDFEIFKEYTIRPPLHGSRVEKCSRFESAKIEAIWVPLPKSCQNQNATASF